MAPDDPHRMPRPDGGEPEPTTVTRPEGVSGSAGSTPIFSASQLQEDALPERIGGYRVVRPIGRGGMGTVYLAIKEGDEFRRRVAVKLIKKGMDTEEIIRRFSVERHVLSALSHPNIARLLDGGTSEDGRPYFVLEYIEGLPIDEYCNANALNIVQRLKLFMKVCAAVHYAHQNLVVHRDLKPGNILVSPDGEPKLLDFGIAKLLNPQMVQVTLATGPEIRLMTPEYASPEQVSGRPVGTTSDVYSLGVLLYELLTGRRPYHIKERIESVIIDIVCNMVPEKPSTAVTHPPESSPADDPTNPAAQPKTGTRQARSATTASTIEGTIEKLRRRLAGDLDDIVLKALEKPPPRRYASAEALAADIQRHLDGLPVLARKDQRDPVYQFKKFVARHRVGVTTAAFVGIALMLGLSFASWQWVRAERANEQLAGKISELAAANAALLAAKTDLTQAVDAVVGVSEVLSRPTSDSPSGAREDVSARKERLDAAIDPLSRFVTDSKGGSRESEGRTMAAALARLLMLRGDVTGGSRSSSGGDAAAAIPDYDRARAVLEEIAREAPSSAALEMQLSDVAMRRADAFLRLGRTDEALSDYQRAARHSRNAASIAGENTLTHRRTAASILEIAMILARHGRLDEALAEAQQSVELRRANLAGADNEEQSRRDLSIGLTNMAEILLLKRDDAAAEAAYSEALEIRRSLLQLRPDSERYQRDMATALLGFGRFLMARSREEEAVTPLMESRSLLASLHSALPQDKRVQLNLAQTEERIGSVRNRLGQADMARSHFAHAIELADELVAIAPEDLSHQRVKATAAYNLAETERAAGNWRSALDCLETAGEATTALHAADPRNMSDGQLHFNTFLLLGQAHCQLAAQIDPPTAQSVVHLAAARDAFAGCRSTAERLGSPAQMLETLNPHTAELEKLQKQVEDARAAKTNQEQSGPER